MRVLMVGYRNPSYQTVTEYLESAFRDTGNEVLFLDFRSFLIPGRIRDRVRWLDSWDVRRINRNVRAGLAEFKPDLFFCLGGYTLEPETILFARAQGAKTAFWNGDYPYLFERYLELGRHFDWFFASGTDALERCRAAGYRSEWLPFACDPKIHRPVELTPEEQRFFQSDVLFFGTPYPERVRLFERLTEFDLALWGPGWDRLPSGHALRKFVRGGPLKPEDWVKAVAGTKIAINYMGSSGFDMDPKLEKMANCRVFELLGCGTFQVVDRKVDVELLFQSGEELVMFDRDEDIVEVVRYYLAHPEQRAAIGLAARAKALAEHNYRRRVEKILSTVGLSKKMEDVPKIADN